jgi:hypothetical protein
MSSWLSRKKPLSAENTMRLYYKDHSVNSVHLILVLSIPLC